MPGRPRARRLASGDRRSQLLGHAIAVVARRGLGRGGHGEIARAAGVAVPTVFAYFRTRGEIVAEVLREVARHYEAMADRYYRADNPAVRALLDFGLAFAASVDEDRDRATVLLDWSTAVRSELWPSFLEFHARMVARIEETIRRGQREGAVPANLDANDAALIIVGSAHLVVQMKFSRTPPEKVYRFLLALMRGAIGDDAVATALA